MISIKSIATVTREYSEAITRARLNSVLLSFGKTRVEALGYSYESLQNGVSAWPWGKADQDTTLDTNLGNTVIELKKPVTDRIDRLTVSNNENSQANLIDREAMMSTGQNAA